jgi:uncharacterized protein YlxW (UPF0749 family)
MAAEPAAGPGPGSAPPRPLTTGLLDHLTATALDEDYAHVSRRRAELGEPATPSRSGRPGTYALIALALFGVLVATAALQTSRGADQSASSHASLVKQVQERRAALTRRRAQVRDLTAQVSTLQAQARTDAAQERTVLGRVSRLGLLSGATAVHGPGVQVRVDDAPGAEDAQHQVQAPDLQKLVNGLWQVGAEAVSVNGQRLTALTSIRDAAGAITVNYRSLSRPYTVLAVGDPKKMGADLLDTAGGQTLLTLQSTFGLKFHVDTEDTMTLPAAKPSALRYAHHPQLQQVKPDTSSDTSSDGDR